MNHSSLFIWHPNQFFITVICNLQQAFELFGNGWWFHPLASVDLAAPWPPASCSSLCKFHLCTMTTLMITLVVLHRYGRRNYRRPRTLVMRPTWRRVTAWWCYMTPCSWLINVSSTLSMDMSWEKGKVVLAFMVKSLNFYYSDKTLKIGCPVFWLLCRLYRQGLYHAARRIITITQSWPTSVCLKILKIYYPTLFDIVSYWPLFACLQPYHLCFTTTLIFVFLFCSCFTQPGSRLVCSNV